MKRETALCTTLLSVYNYFSDIFTGRTVCHYYVMNCSYTVSKSGH